MKITAGLILLGVLAIAVVIAWPLVLLWALNALFPLALPYTFKTWLAALILSALFGARSRSSGNK